MQGSALKRNFLIPLKSVAQTTMVVRVTQGRPMRVRLAGLEGAPVRSQLRSADWDSDRISGWFI